MTELAQFRQALYQHFNKRADTLMDLVDALCGPSAAQSVVELSLSPSFRRTYTALYKAVNEFKPDALDLAKLLTPYLSSPHQRSFWLLAVDVTPQPRPCALTLTDRGMVYQPQVVKSNKPVTLGHQYSTVALLPESEPQQSKSWVVPLQTRRVATSEDKEEVGAQQIQTLLRHLRTCFPNALYVIVADTSYSKPEFLLAHADQADIVLVVRVRSNRVFYRQAAPSTSPKVGHPTWYGSEFKLNDPETWEKPDEEVTVPEVSAKGHSYELVIQTWHNLVMRGQRKPKPLPLHRYPFTLIRVERRARENQAEGSPWWLIVMGPRRQELRPESLCQAYHQRFHLEHFFRFCKQKLLLTAFQTPETAREEKWWHLVHLAYAQLWLARHVAAFQTRPWERYLPTRRAQFMSPTLVQRGFSHIIRQLGTPAKVPKRRGIPPGREANTRLPPRPRQDVVVKGLQQGASP